MLTSFSYNSISNITHLNFCVFVMSNKKSFMYQNLKFVSPCGGKFDFFNHLGFEIRSVFDYRTSKIKFYSVRALNCCLNEKILILGRVMATISKFGPKIFETYFSHVLLPKLKCVSRDQSM